MSEDVEDNIIVDTSHVSKAMHGEFAPVKEFTHEGVEYQVVLVMKRTQWGRSLAEAMAEIKEYKRIIENRKQDQVAERKAVEKAWRMLKSASEIPSVGHQNEHIKAALTTLEQTFLICEVCGQYGCGSDHK